MKPLYEHLTESFTLNESTAGLLGIVSPSKKPIDFEKLEKLMSRQQKKIKVINKDLAIIQIDFDTYRLNTYENKSYVPKSGKEVSNYVDNVNARTGGDFDKTVAELKDEAYNGYIWKILPHQIKELIDNNNKMLNESLDYDARLQAMIERKHDFVATITVDKEYGDLADACQKATGLGTRISKYKTGFEDQDEADDFADELLSKDIPESAILRETL